MRCRNCDYPLWNLTTRHCPECGDVFRPSDFDFVRSSVRFRCPQCDTAYYGTSRRGHLVPDSFECTTCHHMVTQDEMILAPAPGFTDDQTDPARNPWLERHRRSWMRSWWDTTWQSMRNPGSLVMGLDERTPSWPAWWYMFLINVVVLIGIVLPVTLVTVVFAYSMSGSAPVIMLAAMGGGFVGVMIGSLIVTVLFVLIWGAVTQVLLRVGGGQPRFGIKRTFDALCYSSGTYLSSIVPCIGWNLGWVWWLVAAVLMVKDGQRVSGLRATLAVLAWPVFATVAGVGLYVAWIGFIVTQVMSNQQAQIVAAAQTETSLITGALVAYASVNDGGPEHALALIADGQLTPGSLCSLQTNTQSLNVPVGDGTLARLPAMGTLELRRRIDEEIALLPPDTVAYRVGDFVFTHRGADVSRSDRDLWIVLRIPDPDVNPAPSAIWVGSADGTLSEIPVSALPLLLENQNAHRESIGLPALPDPMTLLHRRPPPDDAPTAP